MATLKSPVIGQYGSKTRLLQKKLSYERISLTWKTVNVYKYLGSRTNATPSINDIPDPVFLEVADRAYDTTPVEINAWWEQLPEQQMDLSQFGIISPLGDTQQFRFHSYSFEVDGLGRYIMVGDIIEVPFLEQDGNKVFYEITDINRKNENENYIVIASAKPMADSQETTEIPDKNTDKPLFDNLESELVADMESDFTEDGVDTTTTQTSDEPDSRDPYDPRPDDSEDFLDDPNKQIL